MAVPMRKYNPGFLTDDELVESFCVRTSELESIIEALNDSSPNSSSHTIVIGPRGIGKTHLLLRVAVEMRREGRIQGYFPIEFAEESYEVSTCGEFWLECLGRLAEQASVQERADLRLTYEDLRKKGDDSVLAERCLGFLMDYADKHGKRLALIVENLNMLLSEMADPEVGWKLRKTLQTEPRVTLLGSATSRFEEIDHPDQPLYDIFRSVSLHPLSTEECEILWSTVSGQMGEKGAVRPLQILTGGNPRMIAVVAGFRKTHSFHELMNNLLELIDDHTEYFKSHLEALPSQERRVYLALARLWKPATTREIADEARLDTNKCSAFLKRLVDRGAVTLEGGTPRRRQYYLTERLYNIYYLLRRPSGEGQAVKALIQFMSCCYSPGQLLDLGVRIAREYEVSDAHLRQLQELAFRNLLELPEMQWHQEELLMEDEVVSGFGSDETPEIAEQIAERMLVKARALDKEGNQDEAILAYAEIGAKFGQTRLPFIAMCAATSTLLRARLLAQSVGFDAAYASYDEVLSKFYEWKDPKISELVNSALTYKALNLLTKEKPADAVELLQTGLGRFKAACANALGGGALIVLSLGLERMGDLEGAVAQVDRALKVGKTAEIEQVLKAELIVKAVALKEHLLHRLGFVINESEAEELLSHLVTLDHLSSESIDTLISFSAGIGPTRALELIQASEASDLLLPLTTALQQNLGEQPRVALEVEEVASDIREKLLELTQGRQ